MEVGGDIPIESVRLKSPFSYLRNDIICVGKNYKAHSVEFSESGFDKMPVSDVEKPVFFSKAATSIIGTDEVIAPHSDLTEMLDYEGELAVIIGRTCRDVSVNDALSYVWGYTIVNDVTARDLQRERGQWYFGKSLDTFCPMGPVCITSDALDPSDLMMLTYVNGEIRQRANTSEMIYNVPQLISHLSAGITLTPGQVIATGTPAGVGIGYQPPRFLRPNDEIVVEIGQIGSLRNVVGEH